MPYIYTQLALGLPVPDLACYNPLEADLYWVRGVDRAPRLFHAEMLRAMFVPPNQQAA